MSKDIRIETDALLLRFFNSNDIKNIFKLSQEEDLKKWIPDQVYKDEKEAKNVLKYLISAYNQPISPADKPFVLGIEYKKTNEIIGHVGLSPIDNGIEIGYAIGDKYKRQGFATEAVSAISSWAIKSINISEIFGIVASENIASSRVLEKSNYIFIKEKKMMHHNLLKNVKIYKYK
ncbi:MAG: GNAT family N-acetyltransferase [Candidatus Marinimicrobia bacterium]|jgi:ribosomal-protein-alanine N-acetyltransferase|nr:GNAT family N-acetyltransferase [Candidatus Neomarinimicrobiota bacterium]MDP6935874.1 GNAT family N-acetyltransferase [Candidatus Neomarinimicrobiota bacterium]